MTTNQTESTAEVGELLPYQANNALKHGHARHSKNCKYSSTYHSWQAMLSRIRYPNRDIKGKYANRGIDVFAGWHNFNNFLADMGERPEGTTLDRIDNDLDYFPNNCRWSTPTAQARNRRNSKLDYPMALEIAVRMYAGQKAKSESLAREIHKGRTWKDAYNAART